MEQMKMTEEQIQKVFERQLWLEKNVLGADLESHEYVLWSQGGQEAFYKKWLWEYLGLDEFANLEASEPIEIIPIGDMSHA